MRGQALNDPKIATVWQLEPDVEDATLLLTAQDKPSTSRLMERVELYDPSVRQRCKCKHLRRRLSQLARATMSYLRQEPGRSSITQEDGFVECQKLGG